MLLLTIVEDIGAGKGRIAPESEQLEEGCGTAYQGLYEIQYAIPPNAHCRAEARRPGNHYHR